MNQQETTNHLQTLSPVCYTNRIKQSNYFYKKLNTMTQTKHCPYLDTLKRKLNYAKEFHPSKVAYYQELIKEWINHTTKNNNN